MSYFMVMQWKSFSVPVDRLNNILKIMVGPEYDGLICDNEQFQIVFKDSPDQSMVDTINTFWAQATAPQFSPSLAEIISGKINDAMLFGQSLILNAAVENVEMGITQVGKTKDVADYCTNIQQYLQSGSMYAALTEINALINAGVPSNLSPFITADRLNSYKNKIQTYLGIPLT